MFNSKETYSRGEINIDILTQLKLIFLYFGSVRITDLNILIILWWSGDV